MIYTVVHRTEVEYDSPVTLARFNVRLRPAPWAGQVLLEHGLTVDPVPWTILDDVGPWVVNRSRLFIRNPLTRLVIVSRFRVEVSAPGFDLAMAVTPSVAQIRDLALAHRDLSPFGPAAYLYASPFVPPSPAITEWARPHLAPESSVLEAGTALMQAIFREFAYDGEATEADTLPGEAFLKKRGVCQDFAHVMLVAARAYGIPAAYVSGYLRTIPPPGKPRLVGADATHAWVALWCGEALGWIGFDPTNNAIARTDHIFTAMGRDYADVAPIDGVFHGGGGQKMEVSVDVAPEGEDATLPLLADPAAG
ncbi:transglutaminase family protein [Novosphingobium flavum]|uniref:Transglutaminase family protein n=1 Tax=Novosphingobium flavum TaxID=1778672 RepID=A0A7X1KMW6_9SPHN|nr:transglutaminase family protein [Novosphingobium flavum]MBC2667032.1 transglutaminase family protein [Novosphingobium flavum]